MAFDIQKWEMPLAFLYALCIGVVFGLLYEVFRINHIMLTGVGINHKKTSFKSLDEITGRILENRTKKQEFPKTAKNRMTGIIIFFEDILFFLIVAILYTVFLYQTNYGQPRVFLYAGTILGFILYYNTAGRIFEKLFGVILSLIRLIGAFVVYKAVIPVAIMVAKAISVPVNAFRVRSIRRALKREDAKFGMVLEDICKGE